MTPFLPRLSRIVTSVIERARHTLTYQFLLITSGYQIKVGYIFCVLLLIFSVL